MLRWKATKIWNCLLNDNQMYSLIVREDHSTDEEYVSDLDIKDGFIVDETEVAIILDANKAKHFRYKVREVDNRWPEDNDYWFHKQ